MEDWVMGFEAWTSPTLEELLPQLPLDERLRLESRLRDRNRGCGRQNNKTRPSPMRSLREEKERDAFMIPHVQNALRHYNARHPGGEYDVVKPLKQMTVGFRGQKWLHINFWARSRSSNKIKRFFAELHYNPLLKEPLDRYKRSCAFCPGHFDILHPIGRKFVCGNDKDRFYQQLTPCKQLPSGLPFM
uniref:DUF3615 domain-containing protein n=1 Tax=Leersia perrieri TaxID=77586 RepID=A0A0D9WX28_9ORYZ